MSEDSLIDRVVSIVPVSTKITTAEDAEQELRQPRDDFRGADESRRPYDQEAIDLVSEALSERYEAMDHSSALDCMVVECRLIDCDNAVETIIQPERRDLNQALIVALSASAQGLRGVQVVAYDAPMHDGTTLLRDDDGLLWPQEKSMLRFVQCTYEVPKSQELVMEDALSTCGRMLFRAVSLHAAGPNDAPSRVLRPALSDVVSTVATVLRNYGLFSDLSPFDTVVAELRQFVEVVGAHDLLVRAAVADFAQLASDGEAEMDRRLMSVAAQTFFICTVYDAISADVTLEDALARTSAYSRAVHLLRVAGTECAAVGELQAYGVFGNSETAHTVRERLCALVAADEPPTLAPVAEDLPIAADGFDYKEYDQLEASDVTDEDHVKPGRPQLPKTNANVVEKAVVRRGNVKTTYTAVMKRDRLEVTVTRICPPFLKRVAERVQRCISSLTIGVPKIFGITIECAQNLSGGSSNEQDVINKFLSGKCGVKAARWMFDRLTSHEVRVRKESSSSLAKFLISDDSDNSYLLTAGVAPELMGELPVMYNPLTKSMYLVVHEDRNPREVKIENGLYRAGTEGTNLGQEYKWGMFREWRKLN